MDRENSSLFLAHFSFKKKKKKGEEKRRKKRREKEKKRKKIFALLGKFLLSYDIVSSQKCFFGKIFGIKLGKRAEKHRKIGVKPLKFPKKFTFWGNKMPKINFWAIFGGFLGK